MKKLLLLWLFLLYSFNFLNAGTIGSSNVYSKILRKNIPYNIYLPDGYNKESVKDLPIIFLLHGLSEDENSWVNHKKGNIKVVMDSLISQNKLPPTVVVMPYGGTSWYIDSKKLYYSAYTQEFFPYIMKKYKVSSKRSKITIGGNSMGGSGALTFFLRSPNRFGKLLLLSPALYNNFSPVILNLFKLTNEDLQTNYYSNLWVNYEKQLTLKTRVFILVGDKDNLTNIDGDFIFQKNAVDVFVLFVKKQDKADLRIIGGGHDWETWQTGLKQGLIELNK